jgi:hypothetical protein
METVDPKVPHPRTELLSVGVPNLRASYTDKEEPRRAMPRTLNDDPKQVASKIEDELPIRAKLRTDKLLPK